MTTTSLIQGTSSSQQQVSYPLYRQLIRSVQRLAPPAKQALQSLYDKFSQGITPRAEHYLPIIEDTSHALVNIATDSGVITTCFGCQCVSPNSKPTDHVIEWASAAVYAWCIWDAFFIVQQVGKPARITSCDPISSDTIEIEFEAGRFTPISAHKLWFSFPLSQGEEQMQDIGAIRSCFCCRTKAFTQHHHATAFAREHHCEVVDMQEMLARTQEMVTALSSPAMSC